MSEDFESQLQRRLTASAQALPYKADRSQVVRARGRRRRIASQAATSLFAIVCLVGVASVVNSTFGRPDNTTQVLGTPDGDSSGGVGIAEQDGNPVDDTEPNDTEPSDSEASADRPDAETAELDGPTDSDEQPDPGAEDDVLTVDGTDPAEPTNTTIPNVIPPRGECLTAPPLADVAVTDPGKKVVNVSTEPELQEAINGLTDDTVVLLAPGTYNLSSGLLVRADRVTIRGDSTRCDEVVLVGNGMDNRVGGETVESGIWTDSTELKVQNLTIRDVYRHAVQVTVGSDQPEFYNLRLLDAGQAFIISNSTNPGGGASNGVVDYVTVSYSDGPPRTDHGGGTGLTNGVNILGGTGWVVSNSRFENLHTADGSDYLWNGAVQLAIGSSNNTIESNVFVDVDRAIASGVENEQPDSSSGDLIRNNMIVMSSGLYSNSRAESADAAIIVWDSPNTKVVHNTIITQGNTPLSIELRFDSDEAEVRNNLTDAPIRHRTGADFAETNNVELVDVSVFSDLRSGNLRLNPSAAGVVSSVPSVADATTDVDGKARGPRADAGAHQYSD